MENEKPSTTELDGNGDRDERGRFVAGNHAATGNPHAKRVAQIRSLLLSEVTDDDLKAIIKTLIAQAVDGDVQAAREILDRCLGKPRQALEIDATVEQSTLLPDSFPRYLDWLSEQVGGEK